MKHFTFFTAVLFLILVRTNGAKAQNSKLIIEAHPDSLSIEEVLKIDASHRLENYSVRVNLNHDEVRVIVNGKAMDPEKFRSLFIQGLYDADAVRIISEPNEIVKYVRRSEKVKYLVLVDQY